MGRGSFFVVAWLVTFGIVTNLTAQQKAYKEGEVIVRFSQSSESLPAGLSSPLSTKAVKQIIAGVILPGSMVQEEYGQVTPGLSLIKLPSTSNVEQALSQFYSSAAVVYAQPNYFHYMATIEPDDQLYGSQWSLKNTGRAGGVVNADINAGDPCTEAGWDIQNNAENIIVAVIDTGIDVNHPDVNENIWKNQLELASDPNGGNGVDDDGNFYADDIKGWDFIGDDANEPKGDNDPMDTHGHGTHVAGIIGAIGNNGKGISGVCWKVKLMPLKVADKNGIGFLTSALVSAITYAADNGASVINASYGGYYYDYAEYNAIMYARQNNVVFVAAAGNSNTDTDSTPHYPSSYSCDNIISVAATDNTDMLASYSCRGLTSVDIAAPGGDGSGATAILSTLPVSAGGYGSMSGTSMAAPHVAGAAALICAVDPNFTYRQVKTFILQSAEKLPALRGSCVSSGRLNLYRALQMSTPGDVNRFDATNVFQKTYESIQMAIDDSQPGDQIIVEPNHWYFENLDFGAKNNVLVRSGEPNAPTDLTVYPQTTVITAADNSISTVRIDTNQDASTELRGFTIRDSLHGGVYISHAAPTISACTITDNSAANGGGVYLSDANVIITDCNIVGNTASVSGAGIYMTKSTPVISGGDIRRNTSTNLGGGIFAQTSPLIVTDCNIVYNQAVSDSGGGVYLRNCDAGFISGGNISYNTALFYGGGIYFEESNNGLINGTIIRGNSCDSAGGGTYLYDSSPDVINCLIVQNQVSGGSVPSGGAGMFLDGSKSHILNCTIADNKVLADDIFGGGICLFYKTTKPNIENCIFSGNRNYAIFETVYKENGISTIVSPASVSHCLFGENLPSDYWDANTVTAYDANNMVDESNINELPEVYECLGDDPLFFTGRLGDYYLSHKAAGQLFDSPAIDMGSDTAANLGMDTLSTGTDNANDANQVDIGCHFNDSQGATWFSLQFIGTPADGGTLTPDTSIGIVTYMQYSQVMLTAAPNPGNQVQSWSGTDNDASISNTNVVTMNDNKTVYVSFVSTMVELHVIYDPLVKYVLDPLPEDGRRTMYKRGTIVNITVDPSMASYRVEWTGTGDNSTSNDSSNDLTNWVKMDAPVGQFEQVTIRLAVPDVLYTPTGTYPHIQDAINAAKNKDTVVIKRGTYDITPSSNDAGKLYIVGKDITLASEKPDDPCVVASTVIRTLNLTIWVSNPCVLNTITPLNSGGIYLSGVSRNTVINGLTFETHLTSQTIWPEVMPPAEIPDGYNGWPVVGGAIAMMGNASPVIMNCVFNNCTIKGAVGLNGHAKHGNGGYGGWAYGGAIYISGNSNPLIKYCSFLNCSATGGDGGNANTEGFGHGGSWDGDGASWDYGPFLPYYKYSGLGGAVYVGAGSNTQFQNCTFKNNRAIGGSCGISASPVGYPKAHYQIDAFGGAVYCEAASSPVFTKCSFINNQIDPNGGGSVHADGIAVQRDKEVLPYSWGGAVAFDGGAIPTFKNCTFTNNGAGGGGAIYGEYAGLLVSDSTFSTNTAYDGGAMYLVEGDYRISRSTFTSNKANGVMGSGGAIVASDANTWLCDSKVQNNTAKGSGGGLYIFGSDTSWLMNCLITDNTAVRDGGGVTAAWYSEPNFMNCTIAKNKVTGTTAKVSYGGGINLSYHVDANMVNCIVYGNTATNGPQISLTDDFFDSETGDVYYNLPSYIRIKYSDVQGGSTSIYKDSGCKVIEGSGNKDVDPKFASGYYLRQPPHQTTNISPCVDRGTGSAAALHFTRHTTSTNLKLDTGNVDVGFHYVKNYDAIGDYNFNGIVELSDWSVMLYNRWFNCDCEFPYWCDGLDLNEDGVVDYTDKSIFTNNIGKTETTKPTPNPMKFSSPPRRNTTTTAVMTAAQAVDNSTGTIHYYFERLSASGASTGVHSPWTTSRTWTDRNLSAGKVYSYRVRATDRLTNGKPGNITGWSSKAYISNSINNDTTKPTPNPSTWAKRPYSVSNTSVSMTATTAKDASGVQYYFDETTGRAGGTDSGWIDTPTYKDTGLKPNVTYAYRVRVRDRSIAKNVTTFSATASVKVIGAPSPNPPIWETEPDETTTTTSGLKQYVHTMTVGECTAPNGTSTVEYYFECVAGNGFSSGWQTNTTYSYVIANRSVPAAYRVKARVRGGGAETAFSTIRYTN